jgi:hypothetical protein
VCCRIEKSSAVTLTSFVQSIAVPAAMRRITSYMSPHSAAAQRRSSLSLTSDAIATTLRNCQYVYMYLPFCRVLPNFAGWELAIIAQPSRERTTEPYGAVGRKFRAAHWCNKPRQAKLVAFGSLEKGIDSRVFFSVSGFSRACVRESLIS